MNRDLQIARIVSGTVRCAVGPQTIIIKKASREQEYIAQEIYDSVFRESALAGLYTDEELYQFLLKNKLWDEDKEKMFAALPKDIEEFKLKLYKLVFKSNERDAARKAMAKAKDTLAQLISARTAYSHLSCSGAAFIAKSRYILGCSLYYPNGLPVFTNETFWEESSDLLDQVSNAHSEIQITETEYRELARTDPWRSIWTCRKSEGHVFGIAPVDYTGEQKSLVGWSTLYDNVYEHPDCPTDEIIADDDMLDGWLIDQRRQREAHKEKQSAGEAVGNDKIRNSEEIFIMADTVEDARKVSNLNDERTKNMQRQRSEYLKKHGIVNEADMPDTKQKIRMQLANMKSKEQ